VHIGIVEDDPDQLDLLQLWAESVPHTSKGYGNAADFKVALQQEPFDLLLIDWMLPDSEGVDLIQWIRTHLGWNIPILVVTARDDEATIVSALNAGADDYLVKPPKRMELAARVAALGRRIRPNTPPRQSSAVTIGHYEYDIQKQSLSVSGEAISLTQKEFDLAVYLLQNPGKLVSRDHLLDKIWGLNTDVDTRTVDTHVCRIRKKLHFDGQLGWKLVSIYRVGYRFDPVETAA
jgi:two-component system response regulator RegX3